MISDIPSSDIPPIEHWHVDIEKFQKTVAASSVLVVCLRDAQLNLVAMLTVAMRLQLNILRPSIFVARTSGVMSFVFYPRRSQS